MRRILQNKNHEIDARCGFDQATSLRDVACNNIDNFTEIKPICNAVDALRGNSNVIKTNDRIHRINSYNNYNVVKNKLDKFTLLKSHADVEVDEDFQQSNESDLGVAANTDNKFYYMYLISLTALSIYFRLVHIGTPNHVCWDETHFGKMSSWYLNRTFFFDVHPPLGKMLIALSGYVYGYDGSFSFSNPGDTYPDNFFIGMRMFCGLLGSAVVPLAFQIVWLLRRSLLSSVCAALFLLCDVGTCTLSRYILLDAILLFFIMASTYCRLKFLCYSSRPFTVWWWWWISATGVSIAGAIGVKFVGLFTILFVGLWTVDDLNKQLCNLHLPMVVLIKHVLARALCLIVLPIASYLLIFYIHFTILCYSGTGDGFFSSSFQSRLIGNSLYNVSMPQYVAFGSVITLKQCRTGGAYLHSHSHLYPANSGLRQQQVTTYSHKDDNNLWRMKPADADVDSLEKPVLVRSGDLVRLEHITTRRNLHSHRVPAPLSQRHYLVSGYGVNGTGDVNDIWMLEIAGTSSRRGEFLQTMRSRLRLRHHRIRCYLSSHDKRLPKWAWEQLETVCTANTQDHQTWWSVEEVRDARLSNVMVDVHSPTFVEMLVESHLVMMQGNSALKSKRGEITSHPWQWPLDIKGQLFSTGRHKVYLLGNPVLFWIAISLKVVAFFSWLLHQLMQKRRLYSHTALMEHNHDTFRAAGWLLLGWSIHYFPFWTMTRILYFHHYFPAFLFSAMFSGVMLDYLVTNFCLCVPQSFVVSTYLLCFGALLGLFCYSFYFFSPMVYGLNDDSMNSNGQRYDELRWLKSWDF